MKFTTIIHPVTGQSYSLYSASGKKMLRELIVNYNRLKQQSGGSQACYDNCRSNSKTTLYNQCRQSCDAAKNAAQEAAAAQKAQEEAAAKKAEEDAAAKKAAEEQRTAEEAEETPAQEVADGDDIGDGDETKVEAEDVADDEAEGVDEPEPEPEVVDETGGVDETEGEPEAEAEAEDTEVANLISEGNYEYESNIEGPAMTQNAQEVVVYPDDSAPDLEAEVEASDDTQIVKYDESNNTDDDAANAADNNDNVDNDNNNGEEQSPSCQIKEDYQIPYQIPDDCKQVLITKNRRDIMRMLHPDKNLGCTERATKLTQEFNTIYDKCEELTDSGKLVSETPKTLLLEDAVTVTDADADEGTGVVGAEGTDAVTDAVTVTDADADEGTGVVRDEVENTAGDEAEDTAKPRFTDWISIWEILQTMGFSINEGMLNIDLSNPIAGIISAIKQVPTIKNVLTPTKTNKGIADIEKIITEILLGSAITFSNRDERVLDGILDGLNDKRNVLLQAFFEIDSNNEVEFTNIKKFQKENPDDSNMKIISRYITNLPNYIKDPSSETAKTLSFSEHYNKDGVLTNDLLLIKRNEKAKSFFKSLSRDLSPILKELPSSKLLQIVECKYEEPKQ